MRTRQVTKVQRRPAGGTSGAIGAAAAALELTAREFAQIVRKVRPLFAETAARYDSGKYPSDVYSNVRAAFLKPARVRTEQLRDALLWKYGHLRKSKSARIPPAHERLITDIQRLWPRLARELPKGPGDAFAFLDSRIGGSTRFITVAFLVHLLHEEKIPIIDQHNFRAVNSLIRQVRPTWRAKRKPSQYADLVLLAAFMVGVIAAWNRLEPSTTPDRSALDRFLMVYGKDLKARHNTALHPTAAKSGAVSGRG